MNYDIVIFGLPSVSIPLYITCINSCRGILLCYTIDLGPTCLYRCMPCSIHACIHTRVLSIRVPRYSSTVLEYSSTVLRIPCLRKFEEDLCEVGTKSRRLLEYSSTRLKTVSVHDAYVTDGSTAHEPGGFSKEPAHAPPLASDAKVALALFSRNGHKLRDL